MRREASESARGCPHPRRTWYRPAPALQVTDIGMATASAATEDTQGQSRLSQRAADPRRPCRQIRQLATGPASPGHGGCRELHALSFRSCKRPNRARARPGGEATRHGQYEKPALEVRFFMLQGPLDVHIHLSVVGDVAAGPSKALQRSQTPVSERPSLRRRHQAFSHNATFCTTTAQAGFPRADAPSTAVALPFRPAGGPAPVASCGRTHGGAPFTTPDMAPASRRCLYGTRCSGRRGPMEPAGLRE